MEQHFQIHETPKGVTFALQGGGTYVLPSRPSVEEVGDLSLMSVAAGAFGEAGSLQAATKAIRANASLSEVGKLDKLLPLRVRALRGIARAVASIDREEKKLADREAEIFAIPSLDKTDASAAIVDGELRSRFERMTQRQKVLAVAEITQPKSERLLHALLRDPLPPQDAMHEAVLGHWRQKRESEHIGDLREIRVYREALDWAKRAALSAGAAVRNSAAMSQLEIAGALAPDADASKGGYAFRVTDADILQARAAASRRPT